MFTLRYQSSALILGTSQGPVIRQGWIINRNPKPNIALKCPPLPSAVSPAPLKRGRAEAFTRPLLPPATPPPVPLRFLYPLPVRAQVAGGTLPSGPDRWGRGCRLGPLEASLRVPLPGGPLRLAGHPCSPWPPCTPAQTRRPPAPLNSAFSGLFSPQAACPVLPSCFLLGTLVWG